MVRLKLYLRLYSDNDRAVHTLSALHLPWRKLVFEVRVARRRAGPRIEGSRGIPEYPCGHSAIV